MPRAPWREGGGRFWLWTPVSLLTLPLGRVSGSRALRGSPQWPGTQCPLRRMRETSHLTLVRCLWPSSGTSEPPAANVDRPRLVGGCTLLGLCRWGGPWPSLRGQHSRTVQRVTWTPQNRSHEQTCAWPRPGRLLPVPPSVPCFLNLSLRLAVTTASVMGVLSGTFGHVLPQQFAFLICAHQGPQRGCPHPGSGPRAQLCLGRWPQGQGTSPHPMGSLSPLQCVSGRRAAVTRVSMEGAQWVTGGPGRRN